MVSLQVRATSGTFVINLLCPPVGQPSNLIWEIISVLFVERVEKNGMNSTARDFDHHCGFFAVYLSV